MSSTDNREDSKDAPARLLVGPAGWSYSDWAGYVYPQPRPKGFHEAAFLAEFFDTIEINTSFYQPMRPDHAAQWIERVAANSEFVFTAKLWQQFTHATTATLEDEKAARAGFDVLRDANKLGAVLLQFPFSFHRSGETLAHLTKLLKQFADYPLVVELRHATWQTPETLTLLCDHHAGFCNIDQPVIGSLPRSSLRRSATCACMAAATIAGSATTPPRHRTNATTIFTTPANCSPGPHAFARLPNTPKKSS